MHPADHRPEICLGTDSFHTSQAVRSAATHAFRGFEIGLDTAFSGTYVPLRYYRQDQRVQSLMVEIRRDIYMPEPVGVADGQAVERLAAAVAQLCRAVG